MFLSNTNSVTWRVLYKLYVLWVNVVDIKEENEYKNHPLPIKNSMLSLNPLLRVIRFGFILDVHQYFKALYPYLKVEP